MTKIIFLEKSKCMISSPPKLGATLAKFDATLISKLVEWVTGQGWSLQIVKSLGVLPSSPVRISPPLMRQTGYLLRHSEMTIARESATITCI